MFDFLLSKKLTKLYTHPCAAMESAKVVSLGVELFVRFSF